MNNKMHKIKILFEGYTSGETNGHSCSTIVLIEDLKMVIDPGTLPNQNILIEKLKENNLTPDNIEYVLITHSHLDHYRNIGMFPNAKSIDFSGVWEGDLWKEHSELKDIEIIKTPGHSDDSISVLVKTEQGIIAICGDVFWKEEDPYANNKELLQKSRKLLLEKADFIIPGHGKMFKTDT